LGERKAVEKVIGGDNSIDSKYTNQTEGPSTSMEGWNTTWSSMPKYYSCGSTKISRNNEFTREIDHSRKDFKLFFKKLYNFHHIWILILVW
jgi:hypothetical protein